MPASLVAYNAPFGLDGTQNRRYLHGLIPFTAQTYTLGGILPVYTAIKDQSGAVVLIDSVNTAPDTMWIQSISGSGFVYGYNKATGKIQIFVLPSAAPGAVNTGLVEYSAVALSAAILADVVEFEAEWVRA